MLSLCALITGFRFVEIPGVLAVHGLDDKSLGLVVSPEEDDKDC